MISRRNIIKLIAILAIIGIGVAYWYYADRRSSPIEEAEKILLPTPPAPVMSDTLVATTLEVPPVLAKGIFAKPRIVNLPQGWHAKLFATNLGKARFMAYDEKGKTLYITSMDRGQVLALPDVDNNLQSDTTIITTDGIKNPNGITFRSTGYGELSVAGTDEILSFPYDSLGNGEDYDPIILPKGGAHFTRTILFDNSVSLYVSVGSTCNVCKDDSLHAAILSYKDDPDEDSDAVIKEGYKPRFLGPEIFASGLRNSVGMTIRPGTSEIWATDNGRDWLGDNVPPDEVNIIKEGANYGWPYCYGNNIVDPAFKDPTKCENAVPPVIEIPAHSAPLGLRFYEQKDTADASRALHGSLLIAYHGSWNRTVPTGYKVVRAVERDGKWELHDFMTGFVEGSSVLGRPVDIIEGPQGELYVSDDASGSIYVLTHD